MDPSVVATIGFTTAAALGILVIAAATLRKKK